MTKKAVGLLFTILLLSLTCEAKAEPSGYVLTLPYGSDSSQCFVGTKAKNKVCTMIKDTIYNCNNIPVLVFDNPKDTSVRGIRNLESGVFFQLLNLSEKEDEMLKKHMRDLYYKSTGHDDCIMFSFHYIVTFNKSGNVKDIYLLNLPGFLNHKVMARIIKKVFRGRNKEWWAFRCKSQPSCYFGRFHIYLGETDDFRSSKDL